jgi:phosphatidylglycerophosphate synthase
MSKLSKEDKFFDLSDYGRPIATFFAKRLQNTTVTPVQVTFLFGICGLIAIYCMFKGFNVLAGFFLIAKSIIDAMDGELSRIKQTPSYTGRYLDSIFDIILNFLFLNTIGFLTNTSFMIVLLAFVCLQLQGTLYNYYYVILRNNSVGGDTTSKIFETETPIAMKGESQKNVNILFAIFVLLYGVYDRIIYFLDPLAYKQKSLPNWFMTLVSGYGLGFQLLIMAVLLAFERADLIIPTLIIYSIFIPIFIGIRRVFLIDQTI